MGVFKSTDVCIVYLAAGRRSEGSPAGAFSSMLSLTRAL